MKKWTDEEIKTLKRVYRTKTIEQLEQMFGRKRSGIFTKASQLGKTRADTVTWTPMLDKYLTENYGISSTTQLAKDLNATRSAVKNRVHQLGLRVTDEQRHNLRRLTTGCTPPNAGKPVNRKVYKAMKPTMFPKGHSPHNERHDGAISVRKDKSGHKYKYIRVSVAKWVLLQRKVWADTNGPIPKAHIIGFKDGDSMNCDISNLYCMSKADNMRRHSAVKNLPDGYVARTIVGKRGTRKDVETIIEHLPEAVKLQRAQILLNREINKHATC